MIVLTGSFVDYTNPNPSFIVLNEKDLTFEIINYHECLDSKLINKDGDEKRNINGNKNYCQGRTSYRPYGIASDNKNIYIASNDIIAAFDIFTYKFKKIITNSGRVNTHQIYYYKDHLYRCDTAVNCITKININTLEETVIDIVEQKIIPSLHECKHIDDKNLYSINSICVANGKLNIICKKYIDLKQNNNQEEYEFYNRLVNLSNTEYNDYVSKLSKYYLSFKSSALEGIKIKDINYRISKHIVFNIETSTFEDTPKTMYGKGHNSILVIGNNVWSLCSSSGKLVKNSKTNINTYNIVDKNNYYLRGMTFKANLLYIFATPDENRYRNISLSEINTNYSSCLLILFNVKNDTIEKKKELPKEIYVINDAYML